MMTMDTCIQVATCTWTYDEWHDVWQTSCGGMWQLMSGTPDDNDMHFCPYCGGSLEEDEQPED